MRAITETLGARLELSVRWVTAGDARGYFVGLATLAQADFAASSAWTCQTLGERRSDRTCSPA